MRVCETTVNFRLSCVVTMATCLLFSHLPFASGEADSQVPNKGTRLSKRDVVMGLELRCQYSPRNCPTVVSMTVPPPKRSRPSKIFQGLQQLWKRNAANRLLEEFRGLLPSYESKRNSASSIRDSIRGDRSPSSSSSSAASLSSSAYEPNVPMAPVDDLGLYSDDPKVNRDLLELLTSSNYDESGRRRSW